MYLTLFFLHKCSPMRANHLPSSYGPLKEYVLPLVIIMGIGIAAVYASLWPLLSYNVPKRIAGTSYGIMGSFRLGCILYASSIANYIFVFVLNYRDKNYEIGFSELTGYIWIQNMFLLLNAFAIICTLALVQQVGIHGGASK